MDTLLVINSSGRVTRSITRQLTQRFAARWQEIRPNASVINRDVGLYPPTPLSEAWIAAAYQAPASPTSDMLLALAESEMLITEIEKADVLIIGAPMYNFGMPSPLKAYFEQVIRVRRTFDFNPENASSPYRPLLAPKPVLIVTSAGSSGFEPGGSQADQNFLDAPLRISLSLMGLSDIEFIRVDSSGENQEQFASSLARAERAVDAATGRFEKMPAPQQRANA